MMKNVMMIGVVFLFVFNSFFAASLPNTVGDFNYNNNEITSPNLDYNLSKYAVSPHFRYVYNVRKNKKYGSYREWANVTVDRFKEWGFNTLGAWSEHTLFSQVPYTYTFISRRDLRWNVARNHPDVFDPRWQSSIKEQIENFTQDLKHDPYLIGYWLDNEMNWGPDSMDKKTLLEEYMSSTYEHIRPGKLTTVKFLIERYEGDVNEFNTVWNMNLKSFDELYDITQLGRGGWKARHVNKKIRGDIKAFNQLVAETYFNVTTSLIRENDPNHLILGVRFHLEGASQEIINISGKYCDIVSINYYRKRIFMYDPIKYLQCFWYATVPLDKWMERYYTISGKPLLVGEFSCKALDSGLPIHRFGACRIVLNQTNRANYFKWYAEKCLEAPYVVGYHWFAYIDKIQFGVDNNFGLVNTYDKPYDLVNHTAEINYKIYDLH